MPAESIPRCPFGSNGDLGSSRLEEQLGGKITPSRAHSKEALCGLGAAYSAEAGGRNVR